MTIDFSSAKIVTWKSLIKSNERYFWSYSSCYVCNNIYVPNHEASLVSLETGLNIFNLGSGWNWTASFLFWPTFLTVSPPAFRWIFIGWFISAAICFRRYVTLPSTEYQWSDYASFLTLLPFSAIESLGIGAEKFVTSGFAAA
jgi:hypothetical protein